MPVGRAKIDLNRCNESPLQGEKPDFWPVSKNNTGSLPLCGNPAGKYYFLAHQHKACSHANDVAALYTVINNCEEGNMHAVLRKKRTAVVFPVTLVKVLLLECFDTVGWVTGRASGL